jgi:hypothetical protein
LEIFVGELKGWGARRPDWPTELLDRLRAGGLVPCPGSADREDVFPAPLVLDESRLSEVDEAWVTVVTPDGPGILVWENAD